MKPVDKVDNAALRHDLSYAQYHDTASRNIADREMVGLDKLKKTPNPTFRERVERAIVKPILSTKANLGLLYCIVLYSSIYIAPLNSHRQTEALLVRLAPRKETSFKK